MPDGSGVTVITGGSSGIGRATARAFAERGHRTVLVARRRAPLEQVAAELSDHAPSTAFPLDLARTGTLEDELTRLAVQAGPVDVLVNCAGHGMYSTFLEHPAEEAHLLMQMHYFAPAATIRAVLPGMLARGRGHIINVASVSAKTGPFGHGAYAAAKAALAALTESLAAEYGHLGVRFSIVHPGLVDTPFFHPPALAPLRALTARRMVSPERVGRAVAGLVDRPRLELCVPRHYRVLDLVRAVSPGALNRLVGRRSTPPGRTAPAATAAAAAAPVTLVDDGQGPTGRGRRPPAGYTGDRARRVARNGPAGCPADDPAAGPAADPAQDGR